MAEKKPRGRPSKLTEEMQKSIVGKLRKGMSIEHAAESSGVSRHTVFEWIRRGEGTDERTSLAKYRDFANALRQASAHGAEVFHQVLVEAALGWRPSRRDPKKRVRSRMSNMRVQSAMWILARRWPEAYGSAREAVNVAVDAGPPGEDGGVRIEIVYAAPEPTTP